jgi:hypothetical protein
MKKITFIVLSLVFLALCLNAIILGNAKGDGFIANLKDYTVFAFSESALKEDDPQVYELDPDSIVRTNGKWSTWGRKAEDFNFDTIKRYHKNNICYMGGGTTSIIFRKEFKSPEIFQDMVTRDADNNPVPHDEVTSGAYRGNLANPNFRKYITGFCKIQIDGGVDGLFLDEVNGGYSGGAAYNWNGNEGFDDYTLADFNSYLMAKYPDYTPGDWKNKFGMTDDNIIRKDVPPGDLEHNFNYRKYLQAHKWNGKTWESSPLDYRNPLAKEWGAVTGNRMYKDETFLGKYTELYWKAIVDELRSYAQEKYGKHILITSNGIFPYTDFNSLGLNPWNPDDPSQQKGADYVPVAGGHLNGSKSLMPIYRKMEEKNRATSGDVPLVWFIDYPSEYLTNYNNLPQEEKKDYWRIFGAEAYACGLYPAFHLKEPMSGLTATAVGTLEFFKEYTLFYKENKEIYRHQNYQYSDVAVGVQGSKIEQNLMISKDGSKYALHLINHNYDKKILPQENFTATIGLKKAPRHVYMVSPDFKGKKDLAFEIKNSGLVIKIDKIVYYDMLVVEY